MGKFLKNINNIYPSPEGDGYILEIVSNKLGSVKTFFSEESLSLVKSHQWRTCFGHKGKRYVNCTLGGKCVGLHRLISNCPSNLHVDHKNGNPLDNRKENLRVCTISQNSYNRFSKGYYFDKSRGKFRASITHGKVTKYIGSFDTEIEAKLAYNTAAIKYHGEFAALHQVDEC